jgi:hypothetical protein
VLRITAGDVAVKEVVPAAGLAGRLTGRLELAGAGETVAQVIASSGGGGTMRIVDGRIEQADIAGLRRAFAKAVVDENLMERQRLAALVAAETARGPLTGLGFEAPLIAASGAVKLSFSRQDLPSGGGAEGAANLDLKALALDSRLGLSALSAGLPENQVPLAAAITWKGPLFATKREVDAAALLQAVSVERLRLELERVELLEFDQREQAMFNRRLKAFRQKPLPLPPPVDPPAAPAPGAPAQAPPPDASPPKANATRQDSGALLRPADPVQAPQAPSPSTTAVITEPVGGAFDRSGKLLPPPS